MKKRRFAIAVLAALLLAYTYWRRLRLSVGVQEATVLTNATSPTATDKTGPMARARPEPEMVASAPLNFFIIMTNLKSRPTLAANFNRFYNSLLEFSTKQFVLHVICDNDSRRLLSALGNSTDNDSKSSVNILFYYFKTRIYKTIALVYPLRCDGDYPESEKCDRGHEAPLQLGPGLVLQR